MARRWGADLKVGATTGHGRPGLAGPTKACDDGFKGLFLVAKLAKFRPVEQAFDVNLRRNDVSEMSVLRYEFRSNSPGFAGAPSGPLIPFTTGGVA